MKKLLTFLLTALLAFSVGWAETVTDFQETFNSCAGSGGNDGSWSGSIGSATIFTDNSGWNLTQCGGADKCLKVGSSKSVGSAETPSIQVTNETVYNLTFKAGAWNASSEKTTLYISVTGGTSLSASSVTMEKGSWTNFTITFTASSSTAKIKFEGNGGGSRFFLDEVVLSHESGTQPTPTCATPQFSPVGGTYTEAQNVTISSETDGATIVYTINNGSAQTGTTPVSVNVSSTSTIEAYATKNGYNDSETNSATYTINSDPTDNDYYDIDFTDNNHWSPNLPTSSTTTTTNNYNDGTYTITLSASTGYYYQSSGSYLMIGKSGSYITFPAFSRDVEKIVVEGNSGASTNTVMNIYVGNIAVSTATTGSTGTKTYLINENYQTAGTIYTLKVTSAYNAQIKHITIYFKESSSTTVAVPTFSYNDGAVTGSAAVDYGETITINSATGTVISYTTDNTDPSTSNTATLTNSNTEQVIITEGCTIRAIALDGDANESDEVTLTVTVNPLAITLNPAEQSVATGETITVDVTANTLGDVVYDYSCSPAGATVTATDNGFTITSTTAGTYTVTVSAIDEAYREATITGTYTFTAASASTTIYRKVIQSSDLVVGRKYIIVYEGSMSSYPNPAVMGAIGSYGDYITSPTISNNEIDIADYPATSILTLGGNQNDGWTFKLNNGDYMALNSDSNALHTNDGTTTKAKWTVSSSFYLTNVEYDTRTLMSNSASSRFACYTSTQTNQRTYAYLYVQKFSGPEITVTPSSLTLDDIAVGNSSTTGTLNVSGQKLTENVTVTWDNNNFTVNNSTSPVTIPMASVIAEGGVNINVTYSGTSITEETVTLTFASTGAESVTATVTAKKAIPTAPEIDTPTGTYYDDLTPVITAQEGTTLVYTIDGVSTTVNDNEAIIEIPYGTGSTTVTATAYDGNNASETTTVTYTWGTVTVTVNPESGSTFTGPTMTGTITVQPADAEVIADGTNVTFNENNNTFTISNAQVGVPVTVTIMASKGKAETTVEATYTRVAAPAPDAPTFSIPAGAVAAGTQVTITAPAGTTLYVNGQAQTSPYTVTINNATTIQAYCVIDDEGIQSATVTNLYTIQPSGGSGDGNVYEKVTSSELIDDDTYILVYEDTPSAMGTVANGGKGSAVEATWFQHTSTPYQVSVDDACELIAHSTGTQYQYQFVLANDSYLGWISSTNFNLNLDSSNNGTIWTVSQDGTITNVGAGNRGVIYSPNSNGVFAPYATSNAGNNGYAWAYLYHKVSSTPAVVVDAPVITPTTGTYYETQNPTITAGDNVTIYYTTDGSEPTTLSSVYNGNAIPCPYVSGGTTTIKAIAINNDGVASEVTTVTYTWGVPTVSINPAGGYITDDHVTVILSSTPADATIYYTVNGSEPSDESTQYESAFTVNLPEVGDAVTVKAIAYVGDSYSEVATATYTHVEKIINVKAPFFSPIENYIYYGDQQVKILCTTENADIYYEIKPASGANAPDASEVATPSKSSTHYTGSLSMTVGNSYYVKAIAYIGNYASEVAEGWFTIKSTSEWTTPTSSSVTTVLENVAQMRTVAANSRVTFRNPIQVVYMSSMCNDPDPGTYTHPVPEYVYVRDNSGYGVIYFGKGSTMWATQTTGRRNSPATMFEMGDWIAGNEIEGVTGTWENGLIPQVGTKSRDIYSWPASRLGNTPVIAEEATCADVSRGTLNDNLCGHYLHIRKTTLSDVMDYMEFNTNETNDYRHIGTISDGTAVGDSCTYYDRFWLYSGMASNNFQYPYGTPSVTYILSGLGHYDQNWFNDKGSDATFDIFCVGDYYSGMSNPYEVYPLDFLWIFKPVISLASGEYTTEQTVTITAQQPTWTDVPVTIYYKTDDMEDWAEYTSPIIVNSDTHIQAYAQVPTEKFNDIVRSVTVEATYEFKNIKEPIISSVPNENVILVQNGSEHVDVTISTNPASPDAVTLYTLNGEIPTLDNGITIENGSITLNGDNAITQTTTVTAISYIEVSDGQGGTTLLWSAPVTRTYTFVKSNGIVYDLVNTVTDNMVYVIVNKEANMGLSTTQNATNRASTGVKFVNEDTKTQVYGNDELALFVLESANAGRYRFRNINGGGYLTVTTNDVANLNTEAVTSNPSAYTEAAVSFGTEAAGYPATIMFSYDGTNRYLRYFAKGRTFTTNADVTLNKDVFLYGTMTTPLAIIESEIPAAADQQVTVADNLIGAWAINSGTHKYLWAKDMELSIDKTSPVAGQKDYVKNILHYQNHDWDQSNWVILDFSKVVNDNSEISPEDFVGKKLTGGSVIGNYVDDVNYRIVLRQAPDTIVGDKDSNLYPGYDISDVQAETPQNYNLGYNTYMTGNFLNANLNAPYGEGFVAGEDALGTHPGDKLFFMNPKVQEVARVWGVYMGTKDGKDVFTCLEPSLEHMANGWAITGAFAVEWDYNRLNPETYGRPNGLDQVVDEGCIFHAAIVAKNQGRSLRAGQLGEADDASDMSERFIVYPLDFKSGDGNVTAVHELKSVKDIVSIRYYNIMGMESEKPFEGINIVVTRYSDGSASTLKIMR